MTQPDPDAVRELARHLGVAIEGRPECAVECTVHRGAFSSERTYYVTMANGERFAGTEQVCRLWHRDGRRFGRGEPDGGEGVPGLISAKRIMNYGEEVVVGLWNLVDWTMLRVRPEIVHVPPLGVRIE